jgi:succinyl-CoA synthetase alpha subunit
MATVSRILPGVYRDSVALMQLSASLKALPGVQEASAIVATEGNLALLREVGLLETDMAARPSDLLVIVRARTAAAGEAAIDKAEGALKAQAPTASAAGGPSTLAPRSLDWAASAATGANLALVSVPGEYAAAEAIKALHAGLNVMLFSDNVRVEDEVALKRLASERGLLVMGPDCGTAIIDGVPLAFANTVRRGAVGCVAASGTGLQQVTCLVDRFGAGVSQAIGTGGRDLHEAVGGATMLAGLRALAADRETKVVVLVSKPPSGAVARKVLAAAAKVRKPVVVCFLGADASAIRGANLHPAQTLEDAARAAVALAAGKAAPKRPPPVDLSRLPRLAAGRRYVRGLFSGGTFCYEASLILGARLGRVWSNAPVRAEDELADPWKSREHTLVDLGDDLFTRGRPHPMIDHGLRNQRIVREARDPETAVVLFDVVLGHGAHGDPAAAMAPALRVAREGAAKRRRPIALVASVCGTADDPQGLERQEAAFERLGVILAPSNAAAARMAAVIAARQRP